MVQTVLNMAYFVLEILLKIYDEHDIIFMCAYKLYEKRWKWRLLTA